MNRTSVSEVTPPLDPTPKKGDLPYVKVRSIGEKLIEKYSPIVKREPDATKKKTPPLTRQKRNPWTTDEDDRLIALINQERSKAIASGKEEHTNIVYVKIAALLNSGRTAKQCRDRWQNFLRDGIKKGAWTADEEDLIKDLYVTFGAKWSVMAKLFKDRTDNDIKNKWYSMKRKDERNGTNECKNPFADVNFGANVELDFSSLNRHSSSPYLTSTTDVKGESSGCNDNTNVTTATDDNVTAV